MKKVYFIISIIILIIISFSSSLNIQNEAQGSTAGCVGGAPDTTCDSSAGETMFNCTSDCLSPGIPTKSIPDVLDDIIKWILGFGLMISVTFLIWGGVSYVASSGDAQKTENAKKIIKYSILGVLVIGLSYGIIVILDEIFLP